MSNPYTSPSISGFNSSPPPDDGTEVASNQLDWDNHIDKIGNPLKNYAAAIDAAASSAHGLAFGAAVLAKTADYTVTTADRGRFITVTGASTITLPAAADAGEGFPLLIVNIGSDTVTVDADSSETINGSVTQSLPPNAALVITCNGTSWSGVLINSSTAGTFSPTPTGVTSPSGAMQYTIDGKTVTLTVTTLVGGTSNSTAFTVTGLPSAVQPTTTKQLATFVVDNGITSLHPAMVQISTAGVMTLYIDDPFSTSGFTASGVKGLPVAWSITYNLD